MRITLIAVGKLKERHWREAAQEYIKRLGAYATVEIVEITDRDVTRDEVRAMAQEGADILKAIPAGAHVVALDVQGKQMSSERIATWISDHGLQGRSHLALIVGGSSGFAPEVLARVDERVSLGIITLPHQLARVVLLEQVYRAFRIMRNEPYHR
ncbi:MAG: 23S rRNA (pseudouridine(1915)-N(3))-methyltransferase RlmH [Actinomycetota bacterium]|jgi:23S rRNA (pseudouridine1915-N3)-methyltransferase|nr:23S rRNA (pseudouridine(1915)-N(3))-methyltransferase RlmH [Actinomycetota bacterium]